MEAEKGNFYVSAVRSCASAAKRPPQRSEESTAHMHVGISPRSFSAELTSAAKRGVYRPYACLQCGTSPRSSPPQRSEKSTADVYSTGFRRGASLWSSPPQRSEREELGYSAEFHCRAVAAKLTKALVSTYPTCTACYDNS